jgi:indolepyruvate ferredoxin oxidoreductase
LKDYQDQRYADEFKGFVDSVRDAEKATNRGDALSKAVVRNLFKLMAYKDEYEVARLYAGAAFRQQLEETFEGDYKVSFNLAPPMLSKKDTHGHLIKSAYGSWMMPVFKVLAKFKSLRGTAFDVFGYSQERRNERELITSYREMISNALPALKLGDEAASLLLALANVPEKIRGYGHVKAASLVKADQEKAALLAKLQIAGTNRVQVVLPAKGLAA